MASPPPAPRPSAHWKRASAPCRRPPAIERWHREFTREPHVATSPRTKAIAEYIAGQWRTQGLDEVTIHRYDVLSSNPRRVHVEMVAPRRYVPTLREEAYPEDPDSSQPAISGAWTSFSASGDVTAPVVYANSGNPADYDLLRANGIDPQGQDRHRALLEPVQLPRVQGAHRRT